MPEKSCEILWIAPVDKRILGRADKEERIERKTEQEEKETDEDMSGELFFVNEEVEEKEGDKKTDNHHMIG